MTPVTPVAPIISITSIVFFGSKFLITFKLSITINFTELAAFATFADFLELNNFADLVSTIIG